MSHQHWTEFGLRGLPPMSARTENPMPPPLQPLVDERIALLPEPLRGVTTTGTPIEGLFPLRSTGVETRPMAEAAQAFLATLSPDQRAKAVFPLDAAERRTWINVHMYLFRHGVLLDDLSPGTRHLALELMRTTLSAHGYGLAQDLMRINEFLADFTGSPDEYGQWAYFVSIFGDPSNGEPWGWQIDGHHLNLNVTIVGDQLVITPLFFGSEPTEHPCRPLRRHPGLRHRRASWDFIGSFDTAQASEGHRAGRSIHPEDLPRELQHPFDGRMQGGAFHDNTVLPTRGEGDRPTDAQRRLMLITGSVLCRLHAATGPSTDGRSCGPPRRDLVPGTAEWVPPTTTAPSTTASTVPSILIEFDHHPGVVFDNQVPHATMCTPSSARRTVATTAPTCYANTTTSSTTRTVTTIPGTKPADWPRCLGQSRLNGAGS